MATAATKAHADDFRGKDRARKNQAQAERALIVIPKCEDPERRALLETDDAEWLLYYFGPGCELDDPFWYQFTWQQHQMINAIGQAIKYGGDQALAASRGEGKTTLAERILLKRTLTGEVNYSVLFAATGTMADNSLDSIKTAITENPLLAADYPEVCVPVIALEGAPQRANTQRVNGFRHDNGKPYEMAESRFSWCGQEIIFPNVPGSPSARSIIATRGLDAAVRGLKKRGKRPRLAIIDDPDTEDTARSEDQARKLETRIDSAIGGLGGQQRGIGRVMLTTLQSRIAVSYKFTDPKYKPTFKGKRFRFLVKPPERMDLWDEYVQMRRQDLQQVDADGKNLDPHCRRSHAFYLENREAMDAGAEVSNHNRFNPQVLDDPGDEMLRRHFLTLGLGSLFAQVEVSALQRYFNEVARIGPEAVATEFDNDPPEESGPIESGITPHRIQRQVSGYPRKTIPPGCTVLTQGIDVRKIALHWVVRAWRPDGTGFVIDYGVHEVHGTTYGSDDGVDVAVKKSILARIEETKEANYVTCDGEIKPVDLTLVDAGWRTDAVYAACADAGLGVMPVMGFGKSAGCVRLSFSPTQRATPDMKPGDGWKMVRKGRVWLVEADTDRWKAWEHDRWLTAIGKPGTLQMHGESGPGDRLSDDEKSHHSYARHICNEVEIEEPYNGTVRRKWKPKSENTHWLDASYYSDVAANIKGIRVVGMQSATGQRKVATIPQHMKRA